jgi:hypothetical protein
MKWNKLVESPCNIKRSPIINIINQNKNPTEKLNNFLRIWIENLVRYWYSIREK